MKKRAALLLLLGLWGCAGASPALLNARDPSLQNDILAHIRYLSSDELKGRRTGTSGLEKAAEYIADRFRSYGLAPGEKDSYFQPFDITLGVALGKRNNLTLTLPSPEKGTMVGLPLTEGDFIPLAFSESGSTEGDVVFAGFGVSAMELNYDDYAGLDVKGKIVLVLRHEPQENNEKSAFGGKQLTRYSDLRIKAVTAREHGAAGIIIVNDVLNHPGEDDLIPLRPEAGVVGAGILAVHARAKAVEPLFRAAGTTLTGAHAAIDRTGRPASFPFHGVRARLRVDLVKDRGTARNVVAVVQGADPVLKDEALVIGAHYDHLGMGGEGSLNPSPAPAIHPGADDNASGTAGLLELAGLFAGLRPARSIVFAAFAGEEEGLVGSSYFVRNSPFPLEKIVAMINMDMIGRMKDDRVIVFGTDTGKEFMGLLKRERRGTGLTLKTQGDGYGPSDHTPFYARNIPVLHFFTGVHSDYHRPSDTVDKINAAGEARVIDYISRVAMDIAAAPARIAFHKARPGPGPSMEGEGRGYGPLFGIVPDFGEEEKGALVAGVREGTPAEKAGVKQGDLIVRFGGHRIMNLYDLTYALGSHKPGDEVEVTVIRDKKEITMKAVLGKRR